MHVELGYIWQLHTHLYTHFRMMINIHYLIINRDFCLLAFIFPTNRYIDRSAYSALHMEMLRGPYILNCHRDNSCICDVIWMQAYR